MFRTKDMTNVDTCTSKMSDAYRFLFESLRFSKSKPSKSQNFQELAKLEKFSSNEKHFYGIPRRTRRELTTNSSRKGSSDLGLNSIHMQTSKPTQFEQKGDLKEMAYNIKEEINERVSFSDANPIDLFADSNFAFESDSHSLDDYFEAEPCVVLENNPEDCLIGLNEDGVDVSNELVETPMLPEYFDRFDDFDIKEEIHAFSDSPVQDPIKEEVCDPNLAIKEEVQEKDGSTTV